MKRIYFLFLILVLTAVVLIYKISSDTVSNKTSVLSNSQFINTLYIQGAPINNASQQSNKTVEIPVPANYLFTPLSIVEDKIAARERKLCSEMPWVKQSLLIKPNLDMFDTNKPFTANIFSNALYKIVFESKKKASGVSTNTIWRGKIEGIKLADVLFVVTPEKITEGYIKIHGKTLYEICYVADGIHALREVDETKQPPSAPPRIPENIGRR